MGRSGPVQERRQQSAAQASAADAAGARQAPASRAQHAVLLLLLLQLKLLPSSYKTLFCKEFVNLGGSAPCLK